MRKTLLIGLLLAVVGLFYYSWQGSPGAAPVVPATSPAYAAQVRQARQQKDNAFRTSPQSPLDSLARAGFQGLRYYRPDGTYRVLARLVRAVVPTPLALPNSGGTTDAYLRWGTASFELGGRPQTLTVLQKQGIAATGELFVPFADATNGRQTYAAGRYLDLPAPADTATTLLLDFNAAYNPFCAYSHEYSCPRPPAENRLTVPVLAGEQAYRP